MSADALVSIKDLTVTFTGGRAPVHAVNGVDLDVAKGEAVALIGESGSGKSVTLRSLLRLHPPRRTVMRGAIRVAGTDVMALGAGPLANYRGGVASVTPTSPAWPQAPSLMHPRDSGAFRRAPRFSMGRCPRRRCCTS